MLASNVQKCKQKRIGQLQRFSVSYCTLENVQATSHYISFQTHIQQILIPQFHRQLHSSHTKEKITDVLSRDETAQDQRRLTEIQT